jgi:hypothetical protein
MSDFNGTFQVFTPGGGVGYCPYDVIFKQHEMRVEGVLTAVRKLNASGNHKWSGEPPCSGHPLFHIFSKEGIYVPEIIPEALEWMWGKWRDGEPHNTLQSGLQKLFDWIDQTARSKPKDPLWDGVF